MVPCEEGLDMGVCPRTLRAGGTRRLSAVGRRSPVAHSWSLDADPVVVRWLNTSAAPEQDSTREPGIPRAREACRGPVSFSCHPAAGRSLPRGALMPVVSHSQWGIWGTLRVYAAVVLSRGQRSCALFFPAFGPSSSLLRLDHHPVAGSEGEPPTTLHGHAA